MTYIPSLRFTKRFFSLMEVMISFIMILFCLIPLIYPNLAMYKEQSKFTDSIKLDHSVTLLYGNLLEQLHRRAIPFEQITQKQPTPIAINPEALVSAGIDLKTFPYNITLTAQKELIKGVKNGSFIAALVKFTYVFQDKIDGKKQVVFTYMTPVVKLKPASEQSNENTGSQKPSTPQKKTGNSQPSVSGAKGGKQ